MCDSLLNQSELKQNVRVKRLAEYDIIAMPMFGQHHQYCSTVNAIEALRCPIPSTITQNVKYEFVLPFKLIH